LELTMTKPMNSAQITHRARNVAQVIVGYISTDADGGETIHSDDLAEALRECADTGLLPGGADGVLVWETARGLIPASVAVEGLSPEDHPAAQRSAEPTFPGEDFPEPADGEGARVAREEAAWEAQIKAAPAAPASATTQALTEWCRAAEEAAWERQIKAAPMPAIPVREPDRVPEWLTERYPLGSVWHVDDEAGAPYGLCALRSGGVKATIIGHILIAEHGEAFTSLSGLLIMIGAARIAIHARAWVWIAKRVDA
jgi:hypothetical protein